MQPQKIMENKAKRLSFQIFFTICYHYSMPIVTYMHS